MRGVVPRRRLERGDTIIEVIFAIVIFAFVAISSLAIMNQGIATGEKALEITLVRQEVNAQAEALRYIHAKRTMSPPVEGESDPWADMLALGQSEASPYGVQGGKCSVPTAGYTPFILNARTAEVWQGDIQADYTGYDGNDSISGQLPPYSQVMYDPNLENSTVILAAYGMWIEAVPFEPPANDPERPYVDFHIRACWPAPGSSVPMTIGTIVRLYDPS